MRATLLSPLAALVPRIGVFDSGVGGLSILLALRARLPHTSMLYVGDVAHAPYGERSPRQVLERGLLIVEWLESQGARMIVFACNTATVLAIGTLRMRWPTLVFVGVEPGVKPAAARSLSRRFAVMATVATAHSARLQHLIARYAQGSHVHVQACSGLADAIERGDLHGTALRAVLMPHCEAIQAAEVDTVVLGCTHYAFVEEPIRELLGDHVTFIDTTSAVAERSLSLWKRLGQPLDSKPELRVLSSGSTVTLQRLLDRCAGLAHVEAETLTIIAPTLPG